MSQRVKSSCTPKEPFIKLGEGQAPVLNYNLPQKSAFTAHGAIPLGISKDWFLAKASQEPKDNWWKIPRTDLPKQLDDIVAGRQTSPLIDKNVQAVLATRAAPKVPAPPAKSAAAKPSAAQPKAAKATRSSRAPLELEAVSKNVSKGLRPIAVPTFAGTVTLDFVPQPAAPNPRLYLIEVYKISSYLGDYGAGKTLNTFSLLPGEKTTISITTYRDVTETDSMTQNILDSFSEESANEMETLVEEEMGVSSSNSTTNSATTSAGGGLSVGASILGVEIGVSGNAEHESSTTTETAREENTNVLNHALDKHVEQTSYAREVEVNTSTTATVSEGESQSTVREISNINHSRVLNFVFRQLLQEYITVTWLSDVRVLYTNGYLEENRLMELYTLNDVLPQVIKPEFVEKAKTEILKSYCAVFNYQGVAKQFLQKVEHKIENCEFLTGPQVIVFYRKDPRLTDAVDGITVPGVITKVERHTLPTPAVVVEALLGQGEALDCYNQELQGAAADKADLENRQQRLALEIISSFADPQQKLDAFARIFVPTPEAEEEEEKET